MIDTNPVFIRSQTPEPIIAIVRELRTKGLVQGVDFDFRYHHDNNSYDNHFDDRGYIWLKRGADFYFRDPKWATFITIQYGNN